jgi:lysophospholipase L1-like esterase
MILLLACTAPSAAPTLEPPSGNAFGYTPVRIVGVDAPAVREVWFGDVRAWDLVVEADDTLVVTTQGGQPGAVEVRVITDAGETVLPFAWHPPIDPLFDRVVGFGASLTQGVQNGVPSQHGTLASPAATLARQAGAYLPLPLLVDPLFPAIGPDDVGEPPDCEVPEVADFVARAATEVMAELVDPDTGEFGFQYGRVDPDLSPALVAVGGSTLADVVHGYEPGDFGVQFVAHLVYDPYGDVGASVPVSQLELVEAASPTLVLATDLYGNDVIGAIVFGDRIDPSRMTSEQDFAADLVTLLDRLDATGAEVVLATLPRPSLLPATGEQERRMLADGVAEAEIDAAVAEVDARAAAFDALLREEAAARPRVHVVDLAARVGTIAAEGLPVGDEVLRIEKFGGLLSLDGVHFSDTGYALLANLFADQIEADFGVAVPRVDLADVAATDPSRPAALLDAGLQPDACAR